MANENVGYVKQRPLGDMVLQTCHGGLGAEFVIRRLPPREYFHGTVASQGVAVVGILITAGYQKQFSFIPKQKKHHNKLIFLYSIACRLSSSYLSKQK